MSREREEKFMTDTSTQLSPQQTLMQMLLGAQTLQMIGTAVEMEIPKLLSQGPAKASTIAKEAGTLEDTTYRLMRALSALGILHESEQHEFSLTEMGECLRPDIPGSFDALARFSAASWYTGICSDLSHSMKTGRSAFSKHHGKGLFEWLSERPKEQEVFAHAMSTFSGMEIELIVEAFDFAQYGHVVDVGGSLGMLLARILTAAPNARGTLYDIPSVVARASATYLTDELSARCEIIGGDFFESVPRGGDLYVLKHILHDWDDDHALEILSNVATAMEPGAHLLVLEQGIAPPGVPNPGKVLDMVMLALLEGGRERTAMEHAALFGQVGLRFVRQIHTPGPISLFEGVRQ